MKRKMTATMLAALLVTTVLAGCGKQVETDEVPENSDKDIVETVDDTADVDKISEETDEADITEIPVISENVEVVDTEIDEVKESEAEPDNTDINNITFTYTDMNAIMYARSTVNVRDLPSTAGNKVSSLASNEQVTVTGQCNETGWYRISYNGADAYVSNSYLTSEAVNGNDLQVGDSFELDIDWGADSMAELLGYDTTGEYLVDEGEIYADTDMLPLVNADRAANGVGALTWSSELEQYCIDRIPTLVYNDANNLWIHTGWTIRENVAYRGVFCSEQANDGWINSPEHHDARIDAQYTQYAAACYFYYDESGTIHTFWIEAFK